MEKDQHPERSSSDGGKVGGGHQTQESSNLDSTCNGDPEHRIGYFRPTEMEWGATFCHEDCSCQESSDKEIPTMSDDQNDLCQDDQRTISSLDLSKGKDKHALIRVIHSGLKAAINDHGPVDRGNAWSAAKRVAGQIKSVKIDRAEDIRADERRRLAYDGQEQADLLDLGPIGWEADIPTTLGGGREEVIVRRSHEEAIVKAVTQAEHRGVTEGRDLERNRWADLIRDRVEKEMEEADRLSDEASAITLNGGDRIRRDYLREKEAEAIRRAGLLRSLLTEEANDV